VPADVSWCAEGRNLSFAQRISGCSAILTRCMVRPCVASGFAELAVSGLASMYPASDWSVLCSGPSWISARVRSH
jgi:hypothetical protein